jgi:nucleoside-diphosphate-sugar epimerase
MPSARIQTPALPPLPGSRPTALILGANGRFGTAAALAFAAAGWRVLAQVRRAPNADLSGAVEPLAIGLSDTDAIAAAAPEARVVVHAVNPVYTRWDAEALPSLHSGLALAERIGAHFMFPGNVYNFGESMPPLLSESTPQRPSTRKGQVRVDMEDLIAQRAASGRFTASVVRAGDFFGSGTGNWFDQAIVKSLRAGKLVYPGPLDLPHTWAYLPDLARAFVRVAQRDKAETFATFHFEGHTLTGQELLRGIEQAATELGIAPPQGFRRGSLPWGLIGVVGLLVPTWRELARMSYLWRVPHALDGRRIAALSGAALPATPLNAALRESLLALKLAPDRDVRMAL